MQYKRQVEGNIPTFVNKSRKHGTNRCHFFPKKIYILPKIILQLFSTVLQSIISPSDNSGLPMLSSSECYQFPVLVEQMTYRTQLEKNEFLCNNWMFNDVLVRLLDIIAYPIKSKIENIHSRCGYSIATGIHQKLIDNCCHLLTRVLSEIIFQSAPEVKYFAVNFLKS